MSVVRWMRRKCDGNFIKNRNWKIFSMLSNSKWRQSDVTCSTEVKGNPLIYSCRLCALPMVKTILKLIM